MNAPQDPASHHRRRPPRERHPDPRVESLLAWQEEVVAAEIATGVPAFFGLPDRWYDAPHWRCANDHVSHRFLKADGRGDRCLECGASVVMTFPGDVDGPRPTRAYGSSIFDTEESAETRAAFERALGPVTWGGTGVRLESSLAEIAPDVAWDAVAPDYSLYPEFTASIGFLTRGCRLRCGFCVVPAKEGKPRAVASVRELWRGEPYPRHLEILDNDAFAAPLREVWREHVRELRAGGFRVCFSQGLNLRLIDDEAAAMVASLTYTDHSFELKSRRLYTAWDNLRDEGIFRRGVERLKRAGVPPHRLTVYMLVGYDPHETWEERFYRFAELRALKCRPYPMPYKKATRPDLAAFQKWATDRTHGKVPWPAYTPSEDGRGGYKRDPRLTPEACAASDAAWARVVGGWRPEKRRLTVAS